MIYALQAPDPGEVTSFQRHLDDIASSRRAHNPSNYEPGRRNDDELMNMTIGRENNYELFLKM